MLYDGSKLLSNCKCHFRFLLCSLSSHPSTSLMSCMKLRRALMLLTCLLLFLLSMLFRLQNLCWVDKVRSSKQVFGIIHVLSFSHSWPVICVEIDSLRVILHDMSCGVVLLALFRKLFFNSTTAVFVILLVNKAQIFCFFIKLEAFFCVICSWLRLSRVYNNLSIRI
jgi:hypothetical protein